jgi:hypothetical protein
MAVGRQFTVFKRAGRKNFYVQFKNFETGEYGRQFNTGQTDEAAAYETAWAWVRRSNFPGPY